MVSFSGPQSRLSVQTHTRSPGLRKHSPQILFKLGILLQRDQVNFLANAHTAVPREIVPTGIVGSHWNSETWSCEAPRVRRASRYPWETSSNRGHLYLSSRETVSQGEHSVVYKAKRELPRNVLVDEYIFHTCVMEDLKEILAEQDEKNRQRRDPKWDALSGAFIPDKELTEDGKIAITYRGLFRPIESRVQIQGLARGPYCIHMRKTQAGIHPLKAKVYVAAKLSAGDDDASRL